MSTVREQYDSMLDELPAESKLALIEHVPFAKLLEETDPTAYRCGANDFQPTCDVCHHEFWADDTDDEAICASCKEEQEAQEQEEGEANDE
jgi:CDGSH-type Zn-finger protein